MSAASVVTSTEEENLNQLSDHFVNKPFLRYRAQGFPSFPLLNTYKPKKKILRKLLKQYHLVKYRKMLMSTHHMSYKNSKSMPTSPWNWKQKLSNMGMRIVSKTNWKVTVWCVHRLELELLSSIAATFSWIISVIDVKTAFLQTVQAERGVYVEPPFESNDRGSKMWLILCAASGLINSNAKWQF